MPKIVVISDLHCGHHSGLTPPEYQYKETKENERWNKWVAVQKQTFDWYERTMKALQPIDVLIVNGDLIDGTGHRSGGTELISTDPLVQVKIAEGCIAKAKAKKHFMSFGTGYHSGESSDFEELVAEAFKASIGSHDWISYQGWSIDIKHHLAGSQDPSGDARPLLKEAWANEAWAAKGEQPKSDIIIRSHVHKYALVQKMVGDRLVTAFTTPALQGYGSKYGARRCSQPVDFGLVFIEISKKDFRIRPLIPKLPCWRAT